MGNPHDCFVLLTGCLRQLRFDPQADPLISVDDLIDHGLRGADCLDLLRRRWFRAVRGNHEQVTLEIPEGGNIALWQVSGSDWYGRDAAQQRAEAGRLLVRCRRLPLIIEAGCTDTRYVIARTGYPAPACRWQQSADSRRVLWGRHRLSEHLAGRRGAITETDHSWFDHTPLRTSYECDNQHYADTGVVFGGTLALVAL